MRVLLPVLILTLALAACGDSGGDDAPPDEPVATTAGATATTTTEAAGACPAAPFQGTISRTVEAETGDGTHVAASRTDGELVSAYAFDFGTGDTYTVYVGDHQIDAGGVGSATLTAPAGGLLATIFLQSDTPLAAGSTLGLSFVPIVDTGGGASVSGFGADDLSGAVTIIAIEDERMCFEIDTTDPQQRLDGVVSAEFAG